ncbi:MAG: diguanylate cyclase [bacterium]|nr:diguanylate cyclase [bacterium]
MSNKAEKERNVLKMYEREARIVERFRELGASPVPNSDLLKEYRELGEEFAHLLRKVTKMTLIGDANQRKLFLANEQISAANVKIKKQKEELATAYRKLDLISRTDPLTKLANRRDFMEKFQEEINRFERSRKPFAVVLGDIDNFKDFNDSYGHDCGDFVLESLSNLMKESVRKQDVVARWGGEEFIFLLPDSPLNGGRVAAEVIRREIAAKDYSFNRYTLSISMTFGVSEFNGESDMDACIKQADDALYLGKNNGKNRVVVFEK